MTNILPFRGTQLIVLTIQVLDPRLVNSICDSSNSGTYNSVIHRESCTKERIIFGEVRGTVLVAKYEFLLSGDPADLP